MRTFNLTAAAMMVLGTLACSKARPLQGTPVDQVSWQEEIAPLLASNCTPCHSGASPAAGYRTTSYLEALGPKSRNIEFAQRRGGP